MKNERYSKVTTRNRKMSQPTMYHKCDSTGFMERRLEYRYHSETRIDSDEDEKREQLEGWLRHQPLSRRKLDHSDRHIAMLGGN
uniref:Transposase n=1 Tax=Heterorhabditis bacteriophora TaxID=37862 RepID=A0A1I7XHR9_HETBA